MYWLRQSIYHDPWLTPGHTKGDELHAALAANKRVILTDDKVVGEKAPEFRFERIVTEVRPAFERTGYRCIFEIEDLQYDETGLRFRCTRKMAELK